MRGSRVSRDNSTNDCTATLFWPRCNAISASSSLNSTAWLNACGGSTGGFALFGRTTTRGFCIGTVASGDSVWISGRVGCSAQATRASTENHAAGW